VRILITVNSSWNIFNFRAALVSALIADGHEVTVLAPPEPEAALLETMGCSFVPLTMDRKGLSPLNDLAFLLRLLFYFWRLRPDIVLGFTIKNNIFGAVAARLLAAPFLPNVTGLGTAFLRGGWLGRLVPALYRLAFARVPLVFFQNRDDRALFIDRGIVRAHLANLIPGSGIDLRHFAPAPTAGVDRGPAVVFLMIARMLRDKGVEDFVAAARIVLRQHRNVQFQLLGSLDAENRTAIGPTEMDAWVAEGVVEYLGQLADVRPAIVAADCIVLPSYREGMPRTLLEGAAMAKPLIATNVAGCREVVEDGVNGILCRVRDAEDLAAKILSMVDLGPCLRAEMGAAGRRKVEQEYDQAIVIDAYRKAISGFG